MILLMMLFNVYLGSFSTLDSIRLEIVTQDTLGEQIANIDSIWFKLFYNGIVYDSSKVTSSIRTGYYSFKTRSVNVSNTLGHYEAIANVYKGGKSAIENYNWQTISGGLFGLGDTMSAQAKGFLTDKDGYTLSAAGNKSVSDSVLNDSLIYQRVSGTVEVGTKTGFSGTATTVSDKTGYTVSTVSDKTGYSLSGAGNKAVADTIDRVLSSAHGANSWLSGGLSGSKTVNVYIKNTLDSLPIGDVSANILNTSKSLLGIYKTDADGLFSFNCDPGTYLMTKEKYGYNFTSLYDTAIVVSDLTDTIWGTAFIPPTPSAGGLCAIYGYIYDAFGKPKKSAIVNAKISVYPQWIDSVGIVVDMVEDTTDVNGYWVMELYRTGKYIIQISAMGYKKGITVPNKASENIKNL